MSTVADDVAVRPPSPTGKAHIVDTKSFVFWVLVAATVYAGVHLFDEVTRSETIQVLPALGWLGLVQWGIYGAIFLAIVYTHQLFVRRSPWVTMAALLWGGVVATFFAAKANGAMEDIFKHWFPLDFYNRWGLGIAAATNEEILKALGVVALVLLPLTMVRTVLDGWFYGMMVGLGFQVMEDFLYTTQQAGSLSEGVSFLLSRGLVAGLWAHAAYTGIIGAGIGYFVARKHQGLVKRLAVPLVLFVIVWCAHFFWDSEALNEAFGEGPGGFFAVVLIKGLPVLILLLLVVRWGRSIERVEWSDYVSRYVDPDIVPAADAAALLHRSTRKAARRDAARRGGHHAGAACKHLQLAQLRYVQSVREEGADSAAAAEAAASVRELQAMLAAPAERTAAPA